MARKHRSFKRSGRAKGLKKVPVYYDKYNNKVYAKVAKGKFGYKKIS